jgi:hypothetical protein
MKPSKMFRWKIGWMKRLWCPHFRPAKGSVKYPVRVHKSKNTGNGNKSVYVRIRAVRAYALNLIRQSVLNNIRPN